MQFAALQCHTQHRHMLAKKKGTVRTAAQFKKLGSSIHPPISLISSNIHISLHSLDVCFECLFRRSTPRTYPLGGDSIKFLTLPIGRPSATDKTTDSDQKKTAFPSSISPLSQSLNTVGGLSHGRGQTRGWQI
ncbi:unnamed protein product [Mortierella alpina]